MIQGQPFTGNHLTILLLEFVEMAAFNVLTFLSVLLVLLPAIALADDFPSVDKVCDEVQCGKGTCIANSTYDPFNYICQCDPGWKRTRDDDDDLQFLPCVIPNCTLNYDGCQPAPPPVPEKDFPFNRSFFDPCYWIYCGGGTCTKNRTYTHTCTCNPGYSNLLNVSYYPCYSECTLGSDCSRLGIKVANQETATDGGSQGTSILPGKYHWMIILLLSMITVLRD